MSTDTLYLFKSWLNSENVKTGWRDQDITLKKMPKNHVSDLQCSSCIMNTKLFVSDTETVRF